jgi:PAS domain S-box-containing protein
MPFALMSGLLTQEIQRCMYFRGAPWDYKDVARRRVSVREALRSIIMVTTVAALVLASTAFIGSDVFKARREMEANVSVLAEMVAANSVASLVFNDSQSATKVLDSLQANPSVIAATLYDQRGNLFVTRASIKPPAKAPRPYVRFTSRVFEIVRTVPFRGESIGTLYMVCTLDGLWREQARNALVVACILLVSILVAFAVSSRLQRSLTSPIQQLSTIAGRVRSEKDYSLRMSHESESPSEISHLMLAFNEMITEIQFRDEKLKRRREDLEKQVELRTAELRSAKQVAERIATLNSSLSRHKQIILDTAGEGIFGLDCDGMATFVNAAAAHFLDYNVDELVGQRLHDIIHPQDARTANPTACGVCSVVGEPHLRAARVDAFLRRDGRQFAVEYTSSTMSGDGESGVVVTFRDITERRAVERMKDEFVSTVSHELRTPLTSIRGALGLLQAGLLGDFGERGQQMLNIALMNTERLVRLINDILDIERISSGAVVLNRIVTSTADLMRDAVDVIQTLADRASVTVHLDPYDRLVWADRDRIVQTLTNLLGNAVKFSPAGATVRLLGSADSKSYTFSVIDTGRGIPQDHIETVFQRFQQVNASDSRDKGGSGLGLAICRSIVDSHEGRIWVESEIGKGSAFHFTIPLAVAPTIEEPDIAPREMMVVCNEDATTRPVLIVEDDADLARVIAKSLEARGLTTACAMTGLEAMAACRRAPPALMILDIGLPELDGFGVVEWMRNQSVLRNTPLIVYSAAEISAANQEQLQLGHTVFLTKSRVPFTALENCVVELLNPKSIRAA